MRDIPTFPELNPSTVKDWMKSHRLSARKLAFALGISSRTFRNHMTANRPLPRRTSLSIFSIAIAGGFGGLDGAGAVALPAAQLLAKGFEAALRKKQKGDWEIRDARAVAAARRIANCLLELERNRVEAKASYVPSVSMPAAEVGSKAEKTAS
jgi:hypothetical protein